MNDQQLRLVPARIPYEMLFTPTTDWHGRSFELPAFVFHARVQSTRQGDWPTVCGTGMLSDHENGKVEVIDGFREKLKVVLTLNPAPSWFIYPAAQSEIMTPEERQLLKQLEGKGIHVLAVDHIRDLPEELIGRVETAAKDESTPETSTNYRAWMLLAALALTAALIGPMIPDLLDSSQPERIEPTPLTQRQLPAPQFHIMPYNGQNENGAHQWLESRPLNPDDELQGGDRLFMTVKTTSPGHLYAFVIAHGNQLIELFRAERRERYAQAGETLKVPEHGFFLDRHPGETRFVLITRPAADPELQAITQQLPPQDLAVSFRYSPPEGNGRTYALDNGSVLFDGDEFTIRLNAREDLYVYIFYAGSQAPAWEPKSWQLQLPGANTASKSLQDLRSRGGPWERAKRANELKGPMN